MLVIAASIAAATFKLAFVGLMFVVAIVALLVQTGARVFRGGQTDGVIVISMPVSASVDHSAISALLRRHLSKARLESVSANEHGTVLSYNFQDATKASLVALEGDPRSRVAAAASTSISIAPERCDACAGPGPRVCSAWRRCGAAAGPRRRRHRVCRDLFPRLRFAIQRDAASSPVPAPCRGERWLTAFRCCRSTSSRGTSKRFSTTRWSTARSGERQASLSYFDEGLLRFGGEAGVRMHGGGSRITSPRQGFRVFFRLEEGRAPSAGRVRTRRRSARADRARRRSS